MWQSRKILNVSNTSTLNQILLKLKSFSKSWSNVFQLKVLRLKTYFDRKLPCQNPVLRQLEWGMQNGPITKNWFLPSKYFLFRKFCFTLKPMSTIFYQIFIFLPNDRPSKSMMFFISLKKLFLFSRYSNFCIFFPSFPHFSDSKGQMEVE